MRGYNQVVSQQPINPNHYICANVNCRHDIAAHNGDTDVCMLYEGTPSACTCSGFRRIEGPTYDVDTESQTRKYNVKLKPDLKVTPRFETITVAHNETYPPIRYTITFTFKPHELLCYECKHSAASHYKTFANVSGCISCLCKGMVFKFRYMQPEINHLVSNEVFDD